jgi:hypothetical protein
VQLSFGNAVAGYIFPVNQNELDYSEHLRLNEGEQTLTKLRRLKVSGFLTNNVNTQDSFVLLENAVRTGLANPDKDLLFLTDDGTPTGLTLFNKNSLSGVKVVEGPNFPSTKKGEYCVERTFNFTVTSEEILPNTATRLVSFSEKLSFSGGVALNKVRTAISGPNQQQLTVPQSPFRMTQSGRAVGFLGYPKLGGPKGENPPYFPFNFDADPVVDQDSPKRRGQLQESYGVSWHYSFVSVMPLQAVPAVWKG